MYDPSETTIRMASLHSAGIAVPSGGSSGDSRSDAPSAVAVGKSSAKRTKQYIRLALPEQYQKRFEAVRSELGSLGVDDLSPTSVVKHLLDTLFYHAHGTKDNPKAAVATYVLDWNNASKWTTCVRKDLPRELQQLREYE